MTPAVSPPPLSVTCTAVAVGYPVQDDGDSNVPSGGFEQQLGLLGPGLDVGARLVHRRVLAQQVEGLGVLLQRQLLTVSVPPRLTALVGLDAFSHAIESYVSPKASPLTEMAGLEALKLLGRSLLRAVMNEGAPLWTNWIDIAILLFWLAISFVVALKIFRWQ